MFQVEDFSAEKNHFKLGLKSVLKASFLAKQGHKMTLIFKLRFIGLHSYDFHDFRFVWQIKAVQD